MSKYLIKKGKRRISLIKQMMKFIRVFYDRKVIQYKVAFTESCIYGLENIENYGVNKLFGLSFGFLGVHKNSARFGWKPKSNKTIMIYAYVYVDGKRTENKLAEVEINKEYQFSLQILKDKYVFSVFSLNDAFFTPKSLGISHNEISKVSYENFLYFGGVDLAPHDMYFLVKDY